MKEKKQLFIYIFTYIITIFIFLKIYFLFFKKINYKIIQTFCLGKKKKKINFIIWNFKFISIFNLSIILFSMSIFIPL